MTATRPTVTRRKQTLLERTAVLQAWDECFPAHDITTLRIRRPSCDLSAFEPACDVAEAEAKKRCAADPEFQRLNRLNDVAISLQRAWEEMNGLHKRPVPQVIVEAIWHCVRERGLAAFNEAANRERLNKCDEAARAELKRRITRHFGDGK
jgi:hypothetical protein